MTHDGLERDAVEQIAEEFLERYRRGERPTITEYTARHPDLAPRIRALFPTLLLVEELGSSDAGAEGVSGEPPAVLAALAELQRLGDYRILRRIGRGGMGVVYEAEQESLGRHVALKVLPLLAVKDTNTIERFRREARATARLHHTNIVPVFEVGQECDVCYYAMQLIHGQPLDEVLR
jgi:serine/threonine protein kinase